MSWDLLYKTRYMLPDGSIFVEEVYENDKYLIGDELDKIFNGDEEAYYNDRHETKTYFEINKADWEAHEVFQRHPNWVKNQTIYYFTNNVKRVEWSECKRLK